MSKKQVRFEPKTTIINDKSNELITNPEVKNGDDEDGNDEVKCKTKLIDSMWEKLVLYYLSRLKGLCDWRCNSNCTLHCPRKKHKRQPCQDSYRSIDSVESGISENYIVNRITERTIKDCMKRNKNNFTDVASFMAAGYEEGKQEAAKIIVRALKYGLLTGILKKDGSAYRIQRKFTGNFKTRTCKINRKPRRGRFNRFKLKHKMKLRPKKAARRATKKIKKNTCGWESSSSTKLDNEPEIISLQKKRSSDSTIPPSGSSRSGSSTSSEKRNTGPRAKRKRSRVAIKRPVVRKPQRKKRGRSQSKSPTPSPPPSRSRTSFYKPRRLNKFGRTSFKRYSTPQPRRSGSVISTVSVESICTLCREKRKRELSMSDCSSNVKRVKRSMS